MTRVGKQEERRNKSPRRPRREGPKTGPKKDNLPKGFKEHANVADSTLKCFISKVK